MAALEMLLEVLASSTSLRDLDGHNAAVTFLRDLQALLAQSAENRETLLSLDVCCERWLAWHTNKLEWLTWSCP